MSPLFIIKQATIRKQRLNSAQFLMAKAYRGIPIASGTGDIIPKSTSLKTYRGIEYTS